MKTQLRYESGYLLIESAGLPEIKFEISEADAKLIQSVCRLIFCEGKQEGSIEAFDRCKELIGRKP